MTPKISDEEYLRALELATQALADFYGLERQTDFGGPQWKVPCEVIFAKALLLAHSERRTPGTYEVNVDAIGWPEIHAYNAEWRRGQSVYEDAGGFCVRALKALMGIKPDPNAEVVTYREATKTLLEAAGAKSPTQAGE